MTVSNRFRFRVVRHGLGSIGALARREEGMLSESLFEFAMVLPVLSMLLFGIIFGGITLYDYVALNYAVSIGVRTVANNRGVGAASTNACMLGEQALQQAAVGLNTSSSVLTIGMGPQTETFIWNPNLNEPTAKTPLSTCSDLVPGDTVTMTATYPCNLTIPFAHINLCSVPQGPVNTNVPSNTTEGSGKSLTIVDTSQQTGSCPSANGCIAATATARIE